MLIIFLCNIYKEKCYTKRSVGLDAFQLQQFTDIFVQHLHNQCVLKCNFTQIYVFLHVDAFPLCKFTDIF